VDLSNFVFSLLSSAVMNGSALPSEFPISFVDLVDFVPKIHYPEVLDVHIGKFLVQQGSKTNNLLQNRALYEKAISKLEKAVHTLNSSEVLYVAEKGEEKTLTENL